MAFCVRLCVLGVSAVARCLTVVTAETQRTRRLRRDFLVFFVIGAFLRVQVTVGAPIDDLQRSFLNPPDDTRIMMRWWWFGPAVTKAELEREMHVMKDAGIGGFEVQPEIGRASCRERV